MRDIKELLPQIQALVARYLDGKDAFAAAAEELAGILKETIPAAEVLEQMFPSHDPHPEKLRTKELSVGEWMNPPRPAPFVVEAFVLAPGRGAAQEARAQRLLYEALRRAYDAT